MQLTLWKNFKKRKDSTRQPQVAGVNIDVVLKSQTSLENPIFLIQGIDLEYNYCKFGEHYYFIDDIRVSNNEVYELVCSQDVLATYRSEIGALRTYIERSAVNSNPLITDNAISASQEVRNIDYKSQQIPLYSTDGYYVLRTIGRNTSGASNSTGINMYCLTKSQLTSVLSFMFPAQGAGGYGAVVENEIVKSFFNPFQYIVDLKWFPFNGQAFATSALSVNVEFGWWQSSQLAQVINNDGYTFSTTIALPANSYTDFRKFDSRFTHCAIYLPGIGIISLPPSIYHSIDGLLRVDISVDWITGLARYDLYITRESGSSASYRYPIGSYSGQLGINIQIGQTGSSAINSAISGANAIGTALTGNLIGGAIQGVNAVQNITNPSEYINGSGGNKTAIIAYGGNILLYVYNYATGEAPNLELGSPTCKRLLIGDLGGYVKCAGASIYIDGLGGDKDMVNNYLNGGFYYE